jgi:hypothetical protein
MDQNSQNPNNPTISLELTASDVENVLGFMSRATLAGKEAATYVDLTQRIGRQANEQLKAAQAGQDGGE